MKRTILALVLAIQLVIGSMASAIIDAGDPRVSRLFTGGDNFACTVSYIQPPITDMQLTWVLSAGHCFTMAYADSIPADRSSSSTVWGKVNWSVILRTDLRLYEGYIDLAIGIVPEVRDENQQKRFWLAGNMPDSGDAYIIGFPAGVEKVVRGLIIPSGFQDGIGLNIPGSRKVLVEPGVIRGGSSGSPVLNEGGQIIAVLWGYTEEMFQGELVGVAYVTPIEVVHRVFQEMKRR